MTLLPLQSKSTSENWSRAEMICHPSQRPFLPKAAPSITTMNLLEPSAEKIVKWAVLRSHASYQIGIGGRVNSRWLQVLDWTYFRDSRS